MFTKIAKSMITGAGLILALLLMAPVNAENRTDTVTMYGYTSDYAIITEDGVWHEMDPDTESHYANKCVKCVIEEETGDVVSFEYLCVLNAEKKLARAGYTETKTIFSDPADYEFETEKEDRIVVKAYDKTGENVLAEVVIENGIVGSVVEY